MESERPVGVSPATAGLDPRPRGGPDPLSWNPTRGRGRAARTSGPPCSPGGASPAVPYGISQALCVSAFAFEIVLQLEFTKKGDLH